MESLRFHPAARAELIDALVYLEAHRPGYGDKFAAEVEELIERIVQLPESGVPLSGYPPALAVRVFRSRTFRYALIVATVDGEQMVHAIAHQHRKPHSRESSIDVRPGSRRSVTPAQAQPRSSVGVNCLG